MRVRTIIALIEDVHRATGIEPSVTALTDSQKARVLALVNTEMPRIWESEWWPDLMVVEERTVAAGPLVAFAQTGKTTIGAIDAENGIFSEDPRFNPAAIPLKNIQIFNEQLCFGDGVTAAGDTVWVKFRPPVPVFSLVVWSPATSYVAGDLAFSGSNTYRAIQAGSNKAPASNADYWTVVGVPDVFYTYLALKCSAARMTEADGRGFQFNAANNELERIQGTLIDAQNRGQRKVLGRF
jgi:hypothetical protein